MTDKKISELTSITGANVSDANDVLPIVDTSVATTKKITRAELFKSVSSLTVGDAATNRVGIGTNSPAYKLDVSTSGGAIARFINSSSGGTPSSTHGELIVESGEANMGIQLLGTATSNQKILFGDPNSSGSGQLVYDHTSDYMSFFANTTERIRINSSGNVGIGTSSPSNVLDVNADSIRVRIAQTPASASATGNQGEIAWDADYIYVCVATNTWKRVAIATW